MQFRQSENFQNTIQLVECFKFVPQICVCRNRQQSTAIDQRELLNETLKIPILFINLLLLLLQNASCCNKIPRRDLPGSSINRLKFVAPCFMQLSLLFDAFCPIKSCFCDRNSIGNIAMLNNAKRCCTILNNAGIYTNSELRLLSWTSGKRSRITAERAIRGCCFTWMLLRRSRQQLIVGSFQSLTHRAALRCTAPASFWSECISRPPFDRATHPWLVRRLVDWVLFLAVCLVSWMSSSRSNSPQTSWYKSSELWNGGWFVSRWFHLFDSWKVLFFQWKQRVEAIGIFNSFELCDFLGANKPNFRDYSDTYHCESDQQKCVYKCLWTEKFRYAIGDR